MSWVYVSVNPLEPLEVTIKWSDCNQKDTFGGTGGNFDHLITYVNTHLLLIAVKIESLTNKL
jgi:hypothetical protein